MSRPVRAFAVRHAVAGLVALASLQTVTARAADGQAAAAPVDRAAHHVFVIPEFHTESGVVLPQARVVYGTYGRLNAAHDNAVLVPSHYMADHHGYDWLIGPGRALAARYAGPALSLAILGAALFELGRIDIGRIVSLVPARPAFWAIFALAYMVQPLCDWAIYRRLWGIPATALVATMRKTIGNELLFGYVGEAYLYSVARKRGEGAADAFKAVRDVAILSSAMGSVATLVVLALAWPWLAHLSLGVSPMLLAATLVVIAAPPIAALAFRSKLSLAVPVLARIAGWHGLRAFAIVTLTAVLWHLAMPTVAVHWWLVLSAVKLLVSRLPFVSNRELIFAGAVSVMFGHAGDIAALMAMMAALMIAAHVLAGIGTGIGDMAASAISGMRITRRAARRHATHAVAV